MEKDGIYREARECKLAQNALNGYAFTAGK